jgi:hypothetical protein
VIYTVENTALAGRPVSRVVDAQGVEYHDTTRVDTETGEIEYQVRRPDGTWKMEGGKVVRRTVRATPPVTVEFAT